MSARSGRGTTEPGYVNGRGQRVVGPTDIPGDGNQRLYHLHCENCDHHYATNGADIWDRKCPQCQKGTAALPLERRAEQRRRLGRTLARIKRLSQSAPEDIDLAPIVTNDMRSFLKQVIDIEPADLIEVIENFPSYVDEGDESS